MPADFSQASYINVVKQPSKNMKIRQRIGLNPLTHNKKGAIIFTRHLFGGMCPCNTT
jgi:hypothetical protein